MRLDKDRLRILCDGKDVGPCKDDDTECPKCGKGLIVDLDITVEEYEEGSDEEEDDMGGVRDAIAPQAPGPASPITKLEDVERQLYDLLQIKVDDVTREGAAQRPKNERSAETLRAAIRAVNEAKIALKGY